MSRIEKQALAGPASRTLGIFDRMLIGITIRAKLTLVSRDRSLPAYEFLGLRVSREKSQT